MVSTKTYGGCKNAKILTFGVVYKAIGTFGKANAFIACFKMQHADKAIHEDVVNTV